MSEFAMEWARAKARRRRRKPRGRRPGGPWWVSALWLAALLVAYVRFGIEHNTVWMTLGGVATLVECGILRWDLAWWLWERQEGLPHVRADWWTG